jgi:HAD superfamily hydrolase (TIGR01509 family)
MPRGLLVDLDGTLADSLGTMRTAFGCFVTAHCREDSGAEFEKFNGPPLRNIVRQLREEFGLKRSENKLVADYERLLDAIYDEVAPSAGARALLEAANTAEWQVVVVTSNQRARVESWLDKTKLAYLVDRIVCGEDVSTGKPSPEPYRRGLALINADPNDCVGVEDSALGAQAALAAGLRTFGYQPESRPAPHWPRAVIPFSRLDDLAHALFDAR